MKSKFERRTDHARTHAHTTHTQTRVKRSRKHVREGARVRGFIFF